MVAESKESDVEEGFGSSKKDSSSGNALSSITGFSADRSATSTVPELSRSVALSYEPVLGSQIETGRTVSLRSDAGHMTSPDESSGSTPPTGSGFGHPSRPEAGGVGEHVGGHGGFGQMRVEGLADSPPMFGMR